MIIKTKSLILYERLSKMGLCNWLATCVEPVAYSTKNINTNCTFICLVSVFRFHDFVVVISQATSRVWRWTSRWSGGWATTCSTRTSPRAWSWSCRGSRSGSSLKRFRPGSPWASPPCSRSPRSTPTRKNRCRPSPTSRQVHTLFSNYFCITLNKFKKKKMIQCLF